MVTIPYILSQSTQSTVHKGILTENVHVEGVARNALLGRVWEPSPTRCKRKRAGSERHTLQSLVFSGAWLWPWRIVPLLQLLQRLVHADQQHRQHRACTNGVRFIRPPPQKGA